MNFAYIRVLFSRNPRIRKISWNSPALSRHEQFRKLLESEPALIDQSFIQTISDNLLKNDRFYWILTVAQSVVLMLLLSSIYNVHFTLKIFDATIGNNVPLREMLLLTSSMLGLFTFTITVERNFLTAMIETYLMQNNSAAAYPFIRHKYRRLLGIMPRTKFSFGNHVLLGFTQITLIILMMLSGLLGLVALVVLALSIHITVLWQMWHNPQIPALLNHIIILVVVCFDLFGICFVLFDNIRLPVRDFTPWRQLLQTVSEQRASQPTKTSKPPGPVVATQPRARFKFVRFGLFLGILMVALDIIWLILAQLGLAQRFLQFLTFTRGTGLIGVQMPDPLSAAVSILAVFLIGLGFGTFVTLLWRYAHSFEDK